MDSQVTLWVSISVPIGLVSLIIAYFLFIKYKPIPKRKFIVGGSIGALILGLIIGSIFIHEILAAILIGLLIPPFALWTWFMTQPTIAQWNKKRDELLDLHKKRRKNDK